MAALSVVQRDVDELIDHLLCFFPMIQNRRPFDPLHLLLHFLSQRRTR